ncbi:MAG: RNA polymerase factor sigma-54 [Burkholderiaceae bacterium]|nr:RNA polymerase factor sigma-54 [Burkholderiaceae bacterium]
MQSHQSLELRQGQHLALTPQLQQSIRFLQLSTHELGQEIAQALLDNPLLEREPEYDIDAGVAEVEAVPIVRDEWMSTGAARGATSSGDAAEMPENAVAETLSQHLLRQLHATRVEHRDRVLVSLLIAELDDSGYLATSLAEIAACLPPELDVQYEELHAALSLLQSFDPPGVGATSLADCLLLQLRLLEDEDQAVLTCTQTIAAQHLDLLATGNVNRLRETLGCDASTLHAAHALLLRMEPRPGGPWAASTADYVVPEVLVSKQRGTWQASVNPTVLPRLRVNNHYESLLATAPAAPALQDQLQQARGLIRNVHQRFLTLTRVAQAIVDHQREFFEQGPAAMRPLLLRDIAQALEMHESTVSRATRLKYAQTPWGVIELKQLFGSALQTDDGVSTSATAVQVQIRALIDQEPSHKPLSDNKIAEHLAELGVVIARRTVAKYREEAGIAPAIQRRARAAAQGD